MLNTYINDNENIAYPFYGLGALPFPMCCIVGMGICIKGTYNTNPIYASSVSISANTVHVTLCRGTTILGTLYASLLKDDKSALLVAPGSAEVITGYMELGTLPERAIGTYTGIFYIDPSCVQYIPDSVYGYHTNIVVNDRIYALGSHLDLKADGLIEFSGNSFTLVGNSASKDAELVERKTETNGELVETINGYSAKGAKNVYSVKFEVVTEYPDYISFVVNNTAPLPASVGEHGELPEAFKSAYFHGTTEIVINGSTKFPNCYDSAEDEASSAEG